MKNYKFGIQLYTVREPLAEDFEGTLRKLAAMGIQGVELAFFYGGLKPQALADFMKELNLEVCGIYEHFENICNPTSEVYEYAEALGCKYLTSGFPPQQIEDDFAECIKVAQKASETASAKGMTVCYHAHSHEFQKLDGKYYLDLLLEEIPQMAFEADTCWIQQGGEDVVGYMEKYKDRIPLLHVKDVKADGTITELGNGVIDFKPVVAFAASSAVEWVSYEQDITELTPLESAEISMKHLDKLIQEQ